MFRCIYRTTLAQKPFIKREIFGRNFISKFNNQHRYMASFPVQKSDAEWKQTLSPEEFDVLRNKGTERPFVGEYTKSYPAKGYFKCRACSNPLYSAQSKFDSGCGWPAFDKCYKGSIVTEIDDSILPRRIEIMCANCGGHLGHVFQGERFTKTNERHCVNSISVKYDGGNHTADEVSIAP